MKKIIALLLAVLTCISFVSCGKKIKDQTGEKVEGKYAIVGAWMTENHMFTITFYEDGTGKDPDGGKLTWKYKRLADKYIVYTETHDTEFEVEVKMGKEDKEFIIVRNKEYFRKN